MIKKSIVTLCAIGLLFILLGRVLGLSEGRIEQATSVLTYPLLKLQHYVVRPIQAWSYKRQIQQNLLTEYEAVTVERDTLQRELVALQGALADQQPLAEYRTRFSHDGIIAPIILKNVKCSQFYLIDAGSYGGVARDMIAVHNNCLVGKVTEVYPYYSKVLLIGDPTSKVAAYCPSTGAKGIYTAKKGQALLTYVDHREPVSQGERVLSSGLGGLFPRGFCLGIVSQVESTRYGRSIYIKPCFDPVSLEKVYLLDRRVSLT